MRNTVFPLFQSHLDLAHTYWKNLLQPGDSALDATCGNGHDTLVLAQLLFQEASIPFGTLHALDNQPEALFSTQTLLTNTLSSSQLTHLKFHLQCHSKLPQEILPATLRLVVYNLGYLPGANKQHTTCTSTTLMSLKEALGLLTSGGCISVTAYPGHPAGKDEEEALLGFCASLSPRQWSICHHRFSNRRQAPSLFLIQRTTLKHLV